MQDATSPKRPSEQKLYLVMVGYYDTQGQGLVENHATFFVAAQTPQEAKALVKAKPIYAAKNMHADAIQEIAAIDGFRVRLESDPALRGQSLTQSWSYQDLHADLSVGRTT